MLCLFCFALNINAQKKFNFEYGFMTGFSSYLGDIGGEEKEGRPFIIDAKVAKTRWSIAPFVRYKFLPDLSFTSSLNYIRIEGDDKLTTNFGRKNRNLSFRNDIFDLETTLNWLFFNPKRPIGIYPRYKLYFSAYVFAGVGAYYHNPQTLYKDNWVDLQPLKTEGQTSPYSKYGFCFPMGVGFYYTIFKRLKSHRLGLEINWRYTTTDYLDDISSNKYSNPSLLSSQIAIDLNNRNPELGADQPNTISNNYGWVDDGTGKNLNVSPRGNPENNDSFITVNFSYSYVIKGKYNRKKGRKSKILTL